MVTRSGADGEILSVNVGAVREFECKGRIVKSGIWKFPVSGRVMVRGVNLDGDDQADRSAHGGRDKAIYVYAVEDQRWWQGEIDRALQYGEVGENLTTRGIDVTVLLSASGGGLAAAFTRFRSRGFHAGSSGRVWAIRAFPSASRRQAGRAPTCVLSKKVTSARETRFGSSLGQSTTFLSETFFASTPATSMRRYSFWRCPSCPTPGSSGRGECRERSLFPVDVDGADVAFLGSDNSHR